MEEIKAKLIEQAEIIIADINKTSKAAHQRVRKATLEIGKLGKEYRKISVAEDK